MLKLISPRILPRISARNGSLKITNLGPSLSPQEVISFFEADKGWIYSRTKQRSNMILDFKNDSTINDIIDTRQSLKMKDNRRLFFQKISDQTKEPLISILADIPNAHPSTLRNNEKLKSSFIKTIKNSDIVKFSFRDVDSAVDALNSNIEIDGKPLNLRIEKYSRFSMNSFSIFLGRIPLETPNSTILSHPDIAGNVIQIKKGKNAKFAFLFCRDLTHVDKLQKNGLKIDGANIDLEMGGIPRQTKLKDDVSLILESDREFSECELDELGNANQVPVRNGNGYITYINDLNKTEAKNLIFNGVIINGEHFKVIVKKENVITKMFKIPKKFKNSDIEAALDGQMYNLFEGKVYKQGFVSFFDEDEANAFTSININGQDIPGEIKYDNPKLAYKKRIFVKFNPIVFPGITPEKVEASKAFRILNSKAAYSAHAFVDKRNQTVGIINCKDDISVKNLIDQGVMIGDKWALINLKAAEPRN